MDFKDSLKQISERIEKLKDNLLTEEATKNALIMPFLTALGYDVFNPLEVLPEMNCDIGTKKGEKIDYAILKDGEPTMLIECKHWQQDLNLHDNQLLRYFTVSKAKFGILTNGIIYRFYTDLAKPNIMDEKPFLEVNLLDIKENQVEELKKFHKSYFDIDTILSSANELKYMGELKSIITREFTSPSIELVKLWGKQVYPGVFTANISDQFSTLIKKTISNYVNDIISDRLNAAMKEEVKPSEPEQVIPSEHREPDDNGIVTTEEEINAYLIIKSIVRTVLPANRVFIRDAKSYCTVIADDNERKLICRFYFNNPANKKIYLRDKETGDWNKLPINEIDDIYSYADAIISVCQEYK